jgi:hypothetical protein
MNNFDMEHQLKHVESRVNKLEVEQDRLDSEAKVIRETLVGDITGKPGILQNQVKMINALFDEREGAMPRLTAIERRELERSGFVKGVYFVWLVVGTLIGGVITKLIFK